MNLKSKMITGAFWSLLEKGGQQALSLGVFLILARILGPEDYGLANICFIFFTLAAMITAGLVDGVVSNQIANHEKLSSLFWGVNIIGLALSISCVLLSYPLALIMDEPRLTNILIWFSIIPLLVSLASIPNVLILKELDFRIYAIRSILSTIAGGAVGIYMALNDYGPYAIIGQQIVIYTCNNIIIWLSIEWRPKLFFRKSVFFEEIKPGVSVASVNMLGFLNEQAPRFLIATVLGATALGYYALATRLRYSLTEILVRSPLNVIYPAIAKLSKELEKQKRIISNVIYFSALAICPIIAIAITTADQYVPLFFGEKWNDSILILQIFLGASIVMPIIVIIQQIFRAHNKMKIFLKVRAYLMIANISTGLLLFFDDGLRLMVIGLLCITLISAFIFARLLYKEIAINITEDIKGLMVPISSAVISAGAILLQHHHLSLSLNAGMNLAMSVMLGFIVYSAICISFNKNKILYAYQSIANR